jgi:hypothetical protein
MKVDNVLSAKGLGFLLLFSALALIANSINFSQLVGSSAQYFTFFQFMGPIAGGFLGAGAGVLSVLLAQVVSLIFLGKPVELINILRLTPMLFAAFYFAKYAKGKFVQAVVPLACILLFSISPVGSQVWYFSLFWLIPLVALLLPENLLFRSIGSTFTAHAIGGTIWVYFVPTTPAYWLALIPIVMMERSLFALGIAGSYYALNTVLDRVEAVAKSGLVAIDRRYVLFAQKA